MKNFFLSFLFFILSLESSAKNSFEFSYYPGKGNQTSLWVDLEQNISLGFGFLKGTTPFPFQYSNIGILQDDVMKYELHKDYSGSLMYLRKSFGGWFLSSILGRRTLHMSFDVHYDDEGVPGDVIYDADYDLHIDSVDYVVGFSTGYSWTFHKKYILELNIVQFLYPISGSYQSSVYYTGTRSLGGFRVEEVNEEASSSAKKWSQSTPNIMHLGLSFGFHI